MRAEDIKNGKLESLRRVANNAGGTISEDMWDSLRKSKDEKDFCEGWFFKLRSQIGREIGFHNDLSEILGLRKYSLR